LSPRYIILKQILGYLEANIPIKKRQLKTISRCKFFQKQLFYISLFIAASAHLAEENIEDNPKNPTPGRRAHRRNEA
jgi:hypothetical protein